MPDNTVEKTITVAVWEYRNAEGKRRRGYHGDVVQLTADEVERGEREGIFNQPAAGPVENMPFSAPRHAQQFANALRGIQSRTPEPTNGSADVALHHDVRAPGGVDVKLNSGGKPPKAASKPVLVSWLAGSQNHYSSEELGNMNKDELWALIDASE